MLISPISESDGIDDNGFAGFFHFLGDGRALSAFLNSASRYLLAKAAPNAGGAFDGSGVVPALPVKRYNQTRVSASAM